MFPSKLRFLGLTSVFLFMLIAVSAGHSPITSVRLDAQEPALRAGKPSMLRKLLEERLATTVEFAKQTTVRVKTGTASAEELVEATRMAFEAELDLCNSDKERIAVLVKFLAMAKEAEKLAVDLNKAGQGLQGSALKAKAERLRVAIALERAKRNVAAKPELEVGAGNAAQELRDQAALAEKQVAIKRALVIVADVQKMKAVAKMATMKSLVVEARAREAFREMQVRRMEELASNKVVEANLVEESRVRRDAAKAQRITAEGNVAEAESQVALEQARVDVAQLKFEEAELRIKQLKARIQPQR